MTRSKTKAIARSLAIGAIGGFSYLALAAGALTLMRSDAWPHDAPRTDAQPQGWSYPWSCCSGIDCRPVSDAAISERPEGYVIQATGEVIAHGDTRLKNSPDGEFHWCSVAGAEDGRTICLFVPPRSF